MSQQDFFEHDDLDELLRSIKEDLNEEKPEPPVEAPVLPDEYVDLVSEEPEEDEEPGNRLSSVLKALLYVCLVLVASVLLAVFGWNCADEICALTAEDEPVMVSVAEGSRMGEIADMLKTAGLIENKGLFKVYCMFSGAENKIDPGTYELNKVYDYRALVYGMMETGENRATTMVTVPEGYELDDIFVMLQENKVCTVEQLQEAAANYEFDYWFLQDLEYGDYRRLEGYLFPDTYEFYVDDVPENVLAKFLRNFDNKVTDEMRGALPSLNELLQERMAEGGFTEDQMAAAELTFHDIVIVASLVEKEAVSVSESGEIASVIYNRLCSQLYPCLNIDATIQYVLPERKDVLTNADKAVISPYNTYTNAGLPVGPIANPGMNALRAALYPMNTDYYFYALDPSGVHHFSETVYEHQMYLDSLLGEEEVTEVTEETEETTPEE